MSVHPLAQNGFQQGDFYEANRPTYTEEGVQLLADTFSKLVADGVGSGCDVQWDILELGAGTGKFTRAILEKLPQGTRYLATEPSEGFLSTLRKTCPQVESRQWSASSLDLPDSSVRMMVCAQSFHWFANKESLDEIARVLVPGGKLTMIWNLKDTSQAWAGEVQLLQLSLGDNMPAASTFQWQAPLSSHPSFSPAQLPRLPAMPFQGDLDMVLGHYTSTSSIAALPEEEKVKARAAIAEIIRRHLGDAEVIRIPFVTQLCLTTVQK